MTSPFNDASYILAKALSVLEKRVSELERYDSAIFQIKDTAGDPAARGDFHFVINTNDNTLKVYADGAWRTLDSW